ncbi:MAG: hypothetical protein MJZ74_04870 [Muribaculaceae bacterium]|nr:hypothetical protein [Muribaculaceae bacterium]
MNDEFNDHFMEKPEPRKEPVHKETPQEREEREIEESIISRRHDTMRWSILGVIVLLALGIATWTWMHYYKPYSQSVEKGWVMTVSSEGSLFKTIECKMLTQDYVLDTVKVKWTKDTVLVDGCNFEATISNDSLAREAVKWKASGKRVAVYYDEYSGRLPWRGNSTRIVTDIQLDTLAN